MSQELNDLNNLTPATTPPDYLSVSNILDDAMRKLGQVKPGVDDYPNFYDDVLKKLIDLVPLE